MNDIRGIMFINMYYIRVFRNEKIKTQAKKTAWYYEFKQRDIAVRMRSI